MKIEPKGSDSPKEMSGKKLTNQDKIWQINDKIGGGSYGNIYEGIDKNTNIKIAIKKYKETITEDGISSDMLREITALRKLKHKNIIKILDIVSLDESMYIVQELMDMDLHAFITNASASFSVELIKVIMYQIISAIAYIHSRWFFHRDLKPKNILINDNKEVKNVVVKITDFGLCRLYNTENNKGYTKNTMTPLYRAPEVMLGKSEYTKAVDIWSVGCIFAELILRRPLYDSASEIEVIQNVFGFYELKFNTSLEIEKVTESVKISKWEGVFKDVFEDKDGIDLLSQLLTLNPLNRITAKNALGHPFFNSLKQC